MRRSSLLLATAAFVPTFAHATETTSYKYDALGRLTNVAVTGGPNNGVAIDYQFDAAGNRSASSSSGVTPAPTPTPGPTPAPTPQPASVVDASFEQPSVGGGFLYNPSVSGAFFDGPAGIAGNGSAWGFATAPSGSQVAFLQSSDNYAAQIVLNMDGLVAGVQYVVRFKMAQRPGWAPDQIRVAAQGNFLGTFSPGSSNFEQVVTSSFVANGATGTLYFGGNAAPGNVTVGIDDISVMPINASASSSGRVPNASFEQPAVGAGFQPNPAIEDQYFGGSAGVAGNGSAWGFGNAPNGTQTAYLQGSSAVVVNNISGLTAGRPYVVKFWMAKRPYNAANGLRVAFSGQPLGTYTPNSTSFTQQTTITFTPTGSSGQLSFAGTTDGDSGAGIDAITVEPAP